MIAKSLGRISFVIALGVFPSFAARANAQCCGMGGTTAYYPSAYTAYSPVAYSSYYRGGWYPGYWLDRIGARVWGSPSTYVAAYPSSYYTSYAPAYGASYRPAYSAGYATSYAAPAAGYSSCSSCTAGYAPCSSCTSSYAPCSSGCATCATPAVGQAVYQQPTGCASCATPAAVAVPAPSMPAPAPQGYAVPGPTPVPTPAPQSTYGSQNGAPSLEPGERVPADRQQQDAQRPPTNGTNGTNGEQQPVQPEPGGDTNEDEAYKVNGENSTYFQAPKLFDPNDRTAQRSIAPVTTALYEKPASFRHVSTQRITLQQAELDAAGWVSASK